MTSQLITIQYADITGQTDTGKSVEITRTGKPDVEIPYEAGQALSIVQSGVNYQLTATAGDGQWIIEHTDLVALDAYKTTLEGLFPASAPSGSGATDALQEAQIRCTETETVVPVTTVSALLIGANPNRTSLSVFNNHSAIIWISTDNPAVIGKRRVPANSLYVFDLPVPVNALYVRTQSGTGNVLVVEGESV